MTRTGSVQQVMQRIIRRQRIIISAGLVLIMAGLLLGCNTVERSQAGMTETLKIEIRPNASKLFVYRMEDPTGASAHQAQVQRLRAQRRGDRAAGPRDRGGVRSYRLLHANTQRALLSSGFCRDGYLELDRRISANVLWLRGECRDGATEEDRERFGDLTTLDLTPERDLKR